MCNKMSFATKKDAQNYIKITRNNSKRKSYRQKAQKSLTAYKCFYCDGYHLTSSAKKYSKEVKRQQKDVSAKSKLVDELKAIKDLDAKWEWLEKNQADWMTLHDDGRRYLTFDGIRTRVLME